MTTSGNTIFFEVGDGDITFSVGCLYVPQTAAVPDTDGVVFISNITPQDPDNNVGDKEYTTTGRDLVSCVTDTDLVTVQVTALPGRLHYAPAVTIGGVSVPLTELTDRPVLTGTLAVDLDGATSLTVLHEEGASHTITITHEAGPVITAAVFTGGYPGSQTELKAGDEYDLRVTTGSDMVAIEVDDYGVAGTESHSFAATSDKTITLTIEDRGSTTQALGARVRAQNAAGSWGAWYLTESAGSADGVNLVNVNDLYPSVSIIGTISYPATQGALKDSETATVANTCSDFDSILYESANGDLSISSDTTYEATKTAARSGGSYNIATSNFKITAQRSANGSQATASACVKIAHAPQTIAITAAARLRSGGNAGTSAQNHTITITASQQLLSAPTLTAPCGTWQGTGFAGSGTTWTRALQIHDDDTKGAYSFTDLATTNLAGKAVTTIGSGASYTVGGFVVRTLTVSAWPNREAAIGAQVSNTAKLRCTNLSEGLTGTLNFVHQATVNDLDNYYTITSPTGVFNAAGTLWYNCDAANASGNTAGTMQVELEEII